MAYCKAIQTTRNAAASMRYCIEKGGQERVGVKTRGIGCSDVWLLAAKEMDLTRRLAGKAKAGGVEAHLGIISFKPGEFTGKDGMEKMLDFGEALAKELHPDCQCWIAAHRDGTGGKPHLHLRWNHVDNAGNRLQTSHELNRMKKIADRLCMEKGLSVIKKKAKREGAAPLKYTLGEKKMLERGQRSWKEDIRQAVIAAATDSLTTQKFLERMAASGIKVSERAGGYTFTDAKGHKVRGARLGSDFTKQGIQRELQANRAQASEITIYASVDEARAAGVTEKQLKASIAQAVDPHAKRPHKEREGIATKVLKAAGMSKGDRAMVAVTRDAASGAAQVAFVPAKAVANALSAVGNVAGLIPIVGKPIQLVCRLPKQLTDTVGKIGNKANNITKNAMQEQEDQQGKARTQESPPAEPDEPKEISGTAGAAVAAQVGELHHDFSWKFATIFDKEEMQRKLLLEEDGGNKKGGGIRLGGGGMPMQPRARGR